MYSAPVHTQRRASPVGLGHDSGASWTGTCNDVVSSELASEDGKNKLWAQEARESRLRARIPAITLTPWRLIPLLWVHVLVPRSGPWYSGRTTQTSRAFGEQRLCKCSATAICGKAISLRGPQLASDQSMSGTSQGCVRLCNGTKPTSS